MTDVVVGFHRRRRERLEDFPLEGKFAEALIQELRVEFQDKLTRSSLSPSLLGLLLEEGDADDGSRFMSAIYRAALSVKPQSDPDRLLLCEWLIYAACCCIDIDVWRRLLPAVDGKWHRGESGAIPVTSGLVSMIAVAGLSGRAVRITSAGLIEGHIDLREGGIGNGSPAAHVKGVLYDRVFETTTHARSPDRPPLTDEQLRRLKSHYAMSRPDEFNVITLVVPGDDPSQSHSRSVCLSLASELPALFLANATTDKPDGLVKANLTILDLDARCRLVLDQTQGPQLARPSGRGEFAYDVFLCHASENKLEFVDKLRAALDKQGLRVWYDREQIDLIGDNFVMKMNEGLRASQHTIIVFSPQFSHKYWTREELTAAMTRVKPDNRRVMPVLFNLEREAFENEWPLLAGKTNQPAHDASQVDALAQVIADIVAKYKGA